MTKRFKRMRLALELNKFYRRTEDGNNHHGVGLYCFHAVQKRFDFNKRSEIKEMAIRVARSGK